MRYLIAAIFINIGTVGLVTFAFFSLREAFGLGNIFKVEIVVLVFWACAVILGMAVSEFLNKKK